MRKIAQKYGAVVLTLAGFPSALIVMAILDDAIESSVIVAIQLPFLAVQLFALFMLIRYRREIF